MILRRFLLTLGLAAAFAGGVAFERYASPRVELPAHAVPSDGHMKVTHYKLPPNVTSLEVKIYAAGGAGSDEAPVADDCVSIPGERGENGAGDGGAALFCGGAFAIFPGKAGAATPAPETPGK